MQYYVINEEIKNFLHFFYKQQTFGNGDSFSLLNEEHGMPDIVYNIALGFSNAIFQKIKDNSSPFILSLTEKDSPDIESNFYKHININVEIFYNKVNPESRGYFLYCRNEKDFNEKEQLFDNVLIKGTFYVGKDNFLQSFIALLSHELTHSFEDYNRRINGGTNLWDKAASDGLGRLGIPTNEHYQIILKALLYQTATSERNAYVAQIISDIKQYLPYCSSSIEAWQCLNKSAMWRKMIVPIDTFLPKYANAKDKEVQQWCINYFNKVTGKHITTYKDFLKHIYFRWNKFKKKLTFQLAKQMTDAAFENPQWKGLPIDTNTLI